MTPKKEYIIAPAGHGKTEKISDLIMQCDCTKKVLVLTHTNAGVASLRKRFAKKSISSSKYEVSTIDSFAIKYAMAYPSVSGTKSQPKEKEGYDQCRFGATKIFGVSLLQQFLQRQYSLIIVDEYQDCSDVQHQLILQISKNIDCIILGDPMQGIFDIGGCKLISWPEIQKEFKEHQDSLNTPHRWSDGNEKLGEWIRDARKKLESGEEILLKGDGIRILMPANSPEKISCIYKCLNETQEVAIIVDSKNESLRKKLASLCKGRVQVIDAVDSKILYNFLDAIENKNNKQLFLAIISFFEDCMTRTSHFKAPIENKLKNLWSSRKLKSISEMRTSEIIVRNPCEKIQKNNLYQKFLDVFEKSGKDRAKAALVLMGEIEIFIKTFKLSDVGYIYRKDIWISVKKALLSYCSTSENSIEICGCNVRQAISFVGRGFKKIVGTTLLMKGLEYEHVVIDNPDNFDAKNFYVAISRAKSRITIIGTKNIIRKPKPF